MSTAPQWADVPSNSEHWIVPFRGFHVNGQNVISTTGLAMVDTGTTFGSGPLALVTAFYKTQLGGCLPEQFGRGIVCRLEHLPDGWQSLTVDLRLGDEMVHFPVTALVQTFGGLHYGTIEGTLR
jgi:hypothetical protein